MTPAIKPFEPAPPSDEAPKYHLCTFVCMYAGGIHAGIQHSHSVVELLNEWPTHKWVKHWRAHDKIVDVRHAGYQENILHIYKYVRDLNAVLLDKRLPQYPVSLFRESKAALAESATAVSIIVPHAVYDRAEWMYLGNEAPANIFVPDTSKYTMYCLRQLIRSYPRAS